MRADFYAVICVSYSQCSNTSNKSNEQAKINLSEWALKIDNMETPTKEEQAECRPLPRDIIICKWEIM